MKPFAAAMALLGSVVSISACDLPQVQGCRAAIGVAFLDQPVSVRDRMQRISWRESRNTPTAQNGQHYGCLQIATKVHAARIARHGFTAADMKRAWPNAVVARSLFVEQGFRPWAL
jgi:hypothetical protein